MQYLLYVYMMLSLFTPHNYDPFQASRYPYGLRVRRLKGAITLVSKLAHLLQYMFTIDVLRT